MAVLAILFSAAIGDVQLAKKQKLCGNGNEYDQIAHVILKELIKILYKNNNRSNQKEKSPEKNMRGFPVTSPVRNLLYHEPISLIRFHCNSSPTLDLLNILPSPLESTYPCQDYTLSTY